MALVYLCRKKEKITGNFANARMMIGGVLKMLKTAYSTYGFSVFHTHTIHHTQYISSNHAACFGLVFFSLTLLLIIRLHIMCECVRPLTIRCVVVRMSLILLLFFFSSPLSFSRLPKSKIVVCRSSYLILFCIVSYRKSTENIACKGEKGGINCKHRMR